MGPVFVALSLAGSLVGPAEPAARADGGRPVELAIAWRVDGPASDPPTPDQRRVLREALAAREGRPVERVPDDALARARQVVSHAQPVRVRALLVELRATLDRADASYRAGDFERARAEAEVALERLHAQPELPGAVESAREAHLLLAKIAWAEGEGELAEHSLSAALVIDPSATLSTRAAAPALVERYDLVQRALLADRDSWRPPSIELDASAADSAEIEVEIDGVPGLRPVPPGPHFLVVREPGHAPVAAWRERDEVWVVPRAGPTVPSELPAALAAICDVLELDWLVLAERRGQQVGVEAHRCGEGSGALWVGSGEALAAGLQTTLASPIEPASPALFAAWPERVRVDLGLIEAPPQPRPWYRKGWIWGTSVGAAVLVSGAVAAGVLLGGRGSPRVEVDATPFIGGG